MDSHNNCHYDNLIMNTKNQSTNSEYDGSGDDDVTDDDDKIMMMTIIMMEDDEQYS